MLAGYPQREPRREAAVLPPSPIRPPVLAQGALAEAAWPKAVARAFPVVFGPWDPGPRL